MPGLGGDLPAGFERFFAGMGEASESGRYADPTIAGARYGIEADLAGVGRICEEHGLRHQLPAYSAGWGDSRAITEVVGGKMVGGTHVDPVRRVATSYMSAPPA